MYYNFTSLNISFAFCLSHYSHEVQMQVCLLKMVEILVLSLWVSNCFSGHSFLTYLINIMST
jgi:hypothetical protein